MTLNPNMTNSEPPCAVCVMTSHQVALQALHYYVLIKPDRQAFTLNYMREKSLLHILYY